MVQKPLINDGSGMNKRYLIANTKKYWKQISFAKSECIFLGYKSGSSKTKTNPAVNTTHELLFLFFSNLNVNWESLENMDSF